MFKLSPQCWIWRVVSNKRSSLSLRGPAESRSIPKITLFCPLSSLRCVFETFSTDDRIGARVIVTCLRNIKSTNIYSSMRRELYFVLKRKSKVSTQASMEVSQVDTRRVFSIATRSTSQILMAVNKTDLSVQCWDQSWKEWFDKAQTEVIKDRRGKHVSTLMCCQCLLCKLRNIPTFYNLTQSMHSQCSQQSAFQSIRQQKIMHGSPYVCGNEAGVPTRDHPSGGIPPQKDGGTTQPTAQSGSPEKTSKKNEGTARKKKAKNQKSKKVPSLCVQSLWRKAPQVPVRPHLRQSQ